MPPHPRIPAALAREPFHVREALALGVSHRRLAGKAYRRLLPAVWATADLDMTEAHWWVAARKYAPADARFTGATRLQQLGLDLGPHRPLQMVVGRDLHRDCSEVFLHRSDVLPPHDDVAVSPEAVFVEVCRWFTVLDAVAAGDWLVAQGLMGFSALARLCRDEPWRDGVEQARWVARLLDERSRSVPESHVRLFFQAAGLPRPEVNVTVEVAGTLLTPDWWWRLFRVASEYEGSQHQTHRGQYVADIDRYQVYRSANIGYRQITHELKASPRAVVRRVHDALVAGGYTGPSPSFGLDFQALTWTPREAMLAAPNLSVWAPVSGRR